MKFSLLIFLAAAALAACAGGGSGGTTPPVSQSGLATQPETNAISRTHVKLENGITVDGGVILATNVLNGCGGGELGIPPTPPPNNMAELNLVVPTLSSGAGTKLTVQETTTLPNSIPKDLTAGADSNGEPTIALIMTVNHPVSVQQPWEFEFASDCFFCQSNFSVYSSVTGTWDDNGVSMLSNAPSAPMDFWDLGYLGNMATLEPKQTYIFAVFPFLGVACN